MSVIKITVANGMAPYPASSCRDITYSNDTTGPRELLQAFGIPLEIVMNSLVFLIAPALPIFHGVELKDNANIMFKHVYHFLEQSSSQQKITIPENAALGIPPSTAYLWSDIMSLTTADPAFLDLAGLGIHCIIVNPSSLKRSMEFDDEAPDTKKRHIPASTSHDTDIADPDIRERIIQKATTLIEVLSKRSWKLLEDPYTSTSIPFPTLHQNETSIPGLTFDPDDIDGVPSFCFKGRHFLTSTLLPTIISAYNQTSTTTRIALFGTSGSGKAYLLTAAAAVLLSKEIPTVFLTLSGRRPGVVDLRDALLLATVNAPKANNPNAIFDACQGHDAQKSLGKFIRRLGSESMGVKLIFIVIGLDSLPQEDVEYVLGLTQGHLVCFTAGGNTSQRSLVETTIATGRDGHKVLYLNGGLNDDEYTGWMFQQEGGIASFVSDSASKIIQQTTGAVPALLTKVFRIIKAHDSFDGLLTDDHLELGLDIHRVLSNHVQGILDSKPQKASELRRLLMAVLHHDCLEVPSYLVDQRYLYRDEQGHWTTTSHFVYLAVLRCLLDLGDWVRHFDISKWIGCMDIVGGNRSMLGYVVEYGVTAELRKGFETVGVQMPPDLPIISLAKGGGPPQNPKPAIYIPVEFNHRFVDCIAIWQKRQTVHIAPFQITIAKTTAAHSPSPENFFSQDYEPWERAISRTHPGSSITWDFVWVLNSETNGQSTTAQRRGAIPKYRIHILSIKHISPTIYHTLNP
ncbi:hypothetical protein C8R47DRAFT_193575 [Mycena vitilis]|nr:hypothetical protein C8R47DRAFT_193575 [Mycena vitilis]